MKSGGSGGEIIELNIGKKKACHGERQKAPEREHPELNAMLVQLATTTAGRTRE